MTTKSIRISIDLSTAQIEALDAMAKEEKRSRSALIRQAVDDYLDKKKSEPDGEAFGLWSKRGARGLTFQRRIRGEW